MKATPFIIVALLTFISYGAEGILTELPSNTAVLLRDSLTLVCESDSTPYNLLAWDKLIPGDLPAILGTCGTSFGKYNLTGEGRKCQLYIQDMGKAEAGEYQCRSLLQEPTASAAVVVIESVKPDTTPETVNVNSSVILEFEVIYAGSMTAALNITTPTDIEVIEIINSPSNGKVSSSLNLTSSTEGTYSISCDVIFYPDDIQIGDLATNEPVINNILQTNLTFIIPTGTDTVTCKDKCIVWIVLFSIFTAAAVGLIIVNILYATGNLPSCENCNRHPGRPIVILLEVLAVIITLTGLIIGILICTEVIVTDCCSLWIGLFTIALGFTLGQMIILFMFICSCIQRNEERNDMRR